MSRTILIILALAAIVLVVLLATNVININQTREAEVPNISAEGGQLPTFDVDTNEAALDEVTDDIGEAARDAGNAVENVDDIDVDVDTNSQN